MAEPSEGFFELLKVQMDGIKSASDDFRSEMRRKMEQIDNSTRNISESIGGVKQAVAISGEPSKSLLSGMK